MKEYDSDVGAVTNTQFALRGEVFTAKPVMPGDAFDDLSVVEGSFEDGSTSRPFAMCASIIRRTLIEEDRERWDELIGRDVAVPISLKTLYTIATDLIGVETGRPTQPSGPSGNSDGNGSTSSTEGSAPRVAAASVISREEHAST